MISRYVLIRRFAELTGYTIKAMQPTTGNGVWIEQREWSLAPNGQPMNDIKGFSATARARRVLASQMRDVSIRIRFTYRGEHSLETRKWAEDSGNGQSTTWRRKNSRFAASQQRPLSASDWSLWRAYSIAITRGTDEARNAGHASDGVDARRCPEGTTLD